MYGSHPSVMLLIRSTDFNTRVCKLNIASVNYYQTISYHASCTIEGGNFNYLLINSPLNVTIIHWDSAAKLYNTVFSTSGASGTVFTRGISSDGLYYIQDRYGNSVNLDLYMFVGSIYTMVSSFDLNTIGAVVNS